MSYQENTYYKLVDVGKKAVSISENLVKSYPLAKRLLSILKTELLVNLEFGFFTEGYDVIVQGEQGKDLLLICSHKVDVLVDGQKIVELAAPILLGDKGIIEKKSVRAATIAISAGNYSLVIKIPVGKFLKDFKDGAIDDSEFKTERQIYYNLFQEIQHRLFKYVFLQKTLWEEVNLALSTLNIQLISNIIDKQKEVKWSPIVWSVLKQYLKTAYKFPWPEGIEFNVKNFHLILKSILEKRFPFKKYKGSESSYRSQKQIIWRKWLATISEVCIRVMPKEEQPINLGEVELFNPRNFQLMLQNLLWTVEKKFILKKEGEVLPKESTEKLKVRHFFGKEVDSNEFNLNQYLETFEKVFKLKNPNRILTQVAQQTGMVAAKCENEFNVSVARMQRFLEKVKKLAIPTEERVEPLENHDAMVAAIKVIAKSIDSYEKQLVVNLQQYVGEIRLDLNYSPTAKKLIKSCGIEHTKKAVEKSFQLIADALDLNITHFDKRYLLDLFFIFKGTDKDAIRYRELKSHYWIPVLSGAFLKRGTEVFSDLSPGRIIGGPGWENLEMPLVDELSHSTEEGEELEKEPKAPVASGEVHSKEKSEKIDIDIKLDDATGWFIQLDLENKESEPKEHLFIAVPYTALPWNIKTDLSPEELKTKFWPVSDWILNRFLNQLSALVDKSEHLFSKWSKVIETVVIENKVREFENNKEKLEKSRYIQILALVHKIIGIKLPKKTEVSTEMISRQLYNQVLKQSNRDYPDLSVGDRSNKAYTLWRYVQSEIISSLSIVDKDDKLLIRPPESMMEKISKGVAEIFSKYGFQSRRNFFHISNSNTVFSLFDLNEINPGVADPDKIKLYGEVFGVFESALFQVVNQIQDYKNKLKDIQNIKSDFDIEELQVNFIEENVRKLEFLLHEKISEK